MNHKVWVTLNTPMQCKGSISYVLSLMMTLSARAFSYSSTNSSWLEHEEL